MKPEEASATDLTFGIYLIWLAVFSASLLLPLGVVDRYWGQRFLRGLVKPRQTLIYEGRPPWVKTPGMFMALGGLVTLTVLTTTTFFLGFEAIVPVTFSPLVLIWVLLLLASITHTAEPTSVQDTPKEDS